MTSDILVSSTTIDLEGDKLSCVPHSLCFRSVLTLSFLAVSVSFVHVFWVRN